ncbi:MAG: PQQ-dependent dehydrogenase, methanol/ethanol family, partial [Betaproteobacteria bacterium]|nr:PQQ-dependent dehydrogenase, methanol/ethanol family [Betaproteobacteria bacterium]
GGDYFGSRFSTLTQINKDNAKSIQPIWTFSTGALRGHEGGPLVVNGLIYIHTGFPHKIYALSQDMLARLEQIQPVNEKDLHHVT